MTLGYVMIRFTHLLNLWLYHPVNEIRREWLAGVAGVGCPGLMAIALCDASHKKLLSIEANKTDEQA